MEEFITGYCRVFDSARTVLFDTDEQCADCQYPTCAYRADCPIAQNIATIMNDNTPK